MGKLVSIQDVVYEYLSEKGIYDMMGFRRILQIAMRGFSGLNIVLPKTLSFMYVNPDNKGMIGLPSDFIDYVTISAKVNGSWVMLSRNNQRQVAGEVQDGDLVPVDYQSGIQYSSIPHVMEDGNYGSLEFNQVTSVASRHFNIDHDRGFIQVSGSLIGCRFFIEYKSSGVNKNSLVYVPYEYKEAIIEFINWRVTKSDPKSTRGEKADAKQDYIEAENILMNLNTLPNLEEVMEALYGQ